MSLQNKTATLLIITSEASEAERLVAALREGGLPARGVTIPNAERLEETFRQRACDMILCCSFDPNVDLDSVFAAHRKLTADIPLILITDQESAAGDMVKAKRGGARDITRREDYEHLKLLVAREFSDLLQRRNANGLIDRLQLCERRGRELIDVTSAAVAFVQEGMHVDANPAYLALFGYDALDDLQAVPFLDLVVPEQQKQIRDLLRGGTDSARSEPLKLAVRCQRADETPFDAHLLVATSELDNEPCLRLILTTTDGARVETKPSATAEGADNATALSGLLAEIETHVGADRIVEQPFAIFYIRVNSSAELLRDLGLTRGLEVLDEFARSLRSSVDGRGFLARPNDDGFGLIVGGISEFDAKALADRITSTARLPPHSMSREAGVADCAIGYYLVKERAAAAEDILNAAHRLCIGHDFTDREHATGQQQPTSLAARVKQDVEEGDSDVVITRKIEYALHANQLKLVYQPIISLMGDSQENYSVLVRLLDEKEELLEAKDFIGPAIRGGLIEQIDKWAIRAAIQVISEQRRAGHNLCFFINLSEDTFRNPSIILWICDCLREFDVRGNWLTFLFQEELVAGNLSSLGKLIETLKKIKCRVAVNRFGVTDRPELLLQGLSLDYVLLKPSFANDLADDQDKQKRILKLANLAREFNVKSIVTGVEDARALTVLWTAGVDYVQGNFLQRPSPTLEVQA